jgi:hypothetical protein
MAQKKRPHTLTLDERVKVLSLYSDGNGKSCRKIAEELGVGKTQVQAIIKRKAEVLESYEGNISSDRRRLKGRKTGNEEINELCWKWFQDCTTRRVNVSGPLLQSKALKFAKDLKVDTFKASGGWLEAFRKRHNVTGKTLCGEAADVDKNVVSGWSAKLPELCHGYKPADIFNMDETGLFYRNSGKKTLHVKTDPCIGGKQSKERLTVALCASMTGEKLPALMIGKAANPRCFKNINVKAMHISYKSNKKAWMTSYLFEEWLRAFDRKMKRQDRHVLLFLDNAPSHPTFQLENVKLKFFPPNTTSHCQPMDQGIIQTVKAKYRKRQLEYLCCEMERRPSLCGSELLKTISVMDAMLWVIKAWKEVQLSTITKCFVKGGFAPINEVSEFVTPPVGVNELDDDDSLEAVTPGVVSEEDEDESVPLAAEKLSKDLFGCDYKDLADLDCNVATCDTDTCDWTQPASELLKQVRELDAVDQCDSETDMSDDESEVPPKPMEFAKVMECVAGLKQWILEKGNAKILTDFTDLSGQIMEQRLKTACVQSKIGQFFTDLSQR